MRLKRAAVLSLVLCLLLTGCAAQVPGVIPAGVSEEEINAAMQAAKVEEEAAKEPEKEAFVPTPWVPSVIEGYMREELQPEVKDDFYAFVNYEWMNSTALKEGKSAAGTVSDMSEKSREALTALFTDDTLEGHDAILVQDLYALLSDRTARNEHGTELLRPYVEKLESISSVNQLAAYLMENPPFGLDFSLLSFDAEKNPENSSRNSLVIYPTELLLGAAEEYDVGSRTELGRRIDAGNRLLIGGILTRLGYAKEEATEIYEKALAYESILAEHMQPRAVVNDPSYLTDFNTVLSGKYFTETIDRYPLVNLLYSAGITDLSTTIVREPEWLEALNDSFTLDNLEGIRSYLLCHMIKKTAGFLDEEALSLQAKYDSSVYGTDGSYEWEDVIYNTMTSCLCEELSHLYLDTYISEETISDVEGIVALVLESYRIKLRGLDWLADETKAEAINKLDYISVYVGGPGAWTKNAGLSFEGCEDLLAAYSRICAFQWEKRANRFILGSEKGCWDENGLGSYMVNTFYDPTENSINVLGALLNEGAYDPEASIEHNLACIGTAIAHEISHAFDDSGAQYDELGNLAPWWTEEDTEAFREKTERVAAVLSKIEPMEDVFLNGALQSSEMIADISGMAVMLDIARGIEGFNYDLFFRSYAEFWRTLQTQESFEASLAGARCPAYVRVNVTAEQFDEFRTAYNILSGSGMYLPESKRISVW